MSMKIDKPDRVIGYTLLVIGIILIILPVGLALSLLLGGMRVPQLVQTPTGVTDAFVTASVAFSNACLIFFALLIMMWGGSIVSSRGIAMIKEVTFKLTRESLGAGAEIVKEEKTDKP